MFESHFFFFFFASTYQPTGIGLVSVFVPVEIKLIRPAALKAFLVFFFCYM